MIFNRYTIPYNIAICGNHSVRFPFLDFTAIAVCNGRHGSSTKKKIAKIDQVDNRLNRPLGVGYRGSLATVRIWWLDVAGYISHAQLLAMVIPANFCQELSELIGSFSLDVGPCPSYKWVAAHI